jgi:hypothetical protein
MFPTVSENKHCPYELIVLLIGLAAVFSVAVQLDPNAQFNGLWMM